MSGGDRKYDRQRKSVQNGVYKATSRCSINKQRRIKRENARKEVNAKKVLKVPRGTARALRRALQGSRKTPQKASKGRQYYLSGWQLDLAKARTRFESGSHAQAAVDIPA